MSETATPATTTEQVDPVEVDAPEMPLAFGLSLALPALAVIAWFVIRLLGLDTISPPSHPRKPDPETEDP